MMNAHKARQPSMRSLDKHLVLPVQPDTETTGGVDAGMTGGVAEEEPTRINIKRTIAALQVHSVRTRKRALQNALWCYAWRCCSATGRQMPTWTTAGEVCLIPVVSASNPPKQRWQGNLATGDKGTFQSYLGKWVCQLARMNACKQM